MAEIKITPLGKLEELSMVLINLKMYIRGL